MCLVRKHLPIVYETLQWKNIAHRSEIFFFPSKQFRNLIGNILPFLIWNLTFLSIILLHETYRALRFWQGAQIREQNPRSPGSISSSVTHSLWLWCNFLSCLCWVFFNFYRFQMAICYCLNSQQYHEIVFISKEYTESTHCAEELSDSISDSPMCNKKQLQTVNFFLKKKKEISLL